MCKALNGGKGHTVKKKNKELNRYFLAQHFVKPSSKNRYIHLPIYVLTLNLPHLINKCLGFESLFS